MGRRNLFPGRLNGSKSRSDIARKAPKDGAPRQSLPLLPVRRLSKPRGRRRSLGGFCGGPCGRQTPAGHSAKTKM